MGSSKDFTAEEGYNDIASESISNTSKASNSKNTPKKQEKRSYNRLNPREKAPEEYYLNLKMPGDLGRYVAARAAFEFKTRRDFIIGLIEADMKKHPEVMEELNKKRKK